MNLKDQNELGVPGDDFELLDQETTDETDLFGEELEDRFNAKSVSSASSASTAGSCYGSFSTFCSTY